jgi:VanZ family protein
LNPWKKGIRILLTIFVLLWAGFIFTNSLFPASQSSAISGGVVDQVNSILHQIGIPGQITDHMVRKSAHFIEFTLLGILLFLAIRSYSAHPGHHLFVGLFLGLLIPVADEFIQSFIEGRGSLVSDVVLDFSGVLAGTILFFLFFLLATRKTRRSAKWKHLAS